MDYPRFCGCKGCRTCLQCESKLGLQEKGFYQQFKVHKHKISHRTYDHETNHSPLLQDKTPYVFCPQCERLYAGWDVDAVLRQHPEHDGSAGLPFAGVHIQTDFVSAAEESDLLHGIDEMPWQTSQSGRRKQNFGPKTNFKKMKLACGTFAGFPAFSRFVQQRFGTVPLLSTFRTIEQCSLEYDPTKGASIDPHIDDCWIWGERIVTVSLLSDSVLTLTLYEGDRSRYNLPLVDAYAGHLLAGLADEAELSERWRRVVVRLPMPARSLMVLYGGPRYQWEHCVLREDIAQRRVCVAYREFTVPYLPGAAERAADGSREADELRKGAAVLERAAQFWDHRGSSASTTIHS